MCMWAQMPAEPRGSGSPWSWVYRQLCAVQYGCWEQNTGPVPEQWKFLAAEPSLQLPKQFKRNHSMTFDSLSFWDLACLLPRCFATTTETSIVLWSPLQFNSLPLKTWVGRMQTLKPQRNEILWSVLPFRSVFVLLIGDKNAVMADAMCHSQIFWKHFTFGSSKFHVWFTPRFPKGFEIMTFFFFFIFHAIYGI